MKPIKTLWEKWQALKKRSAYQPKIIQQDWELNDRPFHSGQSSSAIPKTPNYGYSDVERNLELLRQMPDINKTERS